MATGLRSRIVRLLKLGLPLLAAAILASVFLIRDRPTSPGPGLTFSEVSLDAAGGGLAIERPRFSGANLGGDLFDFRAESIRPRDLDLTAAEIERIEGRVDFRDGRSVELSARTAELTDMADRLILPDGIEIRTSDGYAARAGAAELRIEAGRLIASGGVEAEGPMGRITADRALIEPDEDQPDGGLDNVTVFRFEDGVKLRYLPPAD